MTEISTTDYSALDKPEITMFLFHPRTALRMSDRDVMIPVGDRIVVGTRFHITGKKGPSLLFFHGNGEIVSDYDDLAKIYNQAGINFLPADYRGYGRSTGRPSVSAMMRDCHLIFEFTENWLKENSYTGPLIVMGRSLGSACALELAACYKERIDALIVESGFAYTVPLLQLLGINIRSLEFKENEGFGNRDKIRKFDRPTLIIHAEQDHIIPFSDGQALYDASPAADKTLLEIPGANHNDIFQQGLKEYMAAIITLTAKLKLKTEI